MCGICGKLIFDPDASVSGALVKTMADTLHHRGPDDEGYYLNGPVGLGFRRLSIIDLQTGRQPISNEDGSIWLVFNGEIYNYRELRGFLVAKGHIFRTNTDTEVIVHLYEEFGEDCVDRLRGMFAFAIWDGRRKTLFMARDRVGIKPLYYHLSNRSIVFASELKAILVDPEVRREVAVPMIDRLLTFDYLPGQETLFKNIHKLEPGSCLVIRNGNCSIRQYWDLTPAASTLSLRDAQMRLGSLLEETVALHMISDVPVGVLLSGGFDSTALLSMARDATGNPLRTYTVGFADSGIPDERPYARLAAQRFGTVHHEISISSSDFENFLPRYVWHMEEPVCEPPGVALFYVAQLARQSVKVLISGEGADEAFAGYPNYRNLQWLERLKRVAGPFKGVVGRGLSGINNVVHSEKFARYSALWGKPFEEYYYSRTSSPFRIFSAHSEDLYTDSFAHAVNRASSLAPLKKFQERSRTNTDIVNRMLYLDTKTWLPDDLLLKADKITMANSVELRVPFLDHRLLEFAASLPGKYKVRGLTTKYIAKRALSRRVPREILQRKKAGFPVPYASWLRKDLREWIRGLLMDRRTVGRGYFRPAGIERLIQDNQGSGRYSKELFTLAVLELWHRAFVDTQPSSPTAGAEPNCAVAR